MPGLAREMHTFRHISVVTRDLDFPTVARAFGDGYFNLIRRGADGSLVLSADRWRLTAFTGTAFRFEAQAPEATPLMLEGCDVEMVTWDQLPRQHVRSQLRFHMRGGDLLTFSGSVDESVLDA